MKPLNEFEEINEDSASVRKTNIALSNDVKKMHKRYLDAWKKEIDKMFLGKTITVIALKTSERIMNWEEHTIENIKKTQAYNMSTEINVMANDGEWYTILSLKPGEKVLY